MVEDKKYNCVRCTVATDDFKEMAQHCRATGHIMESNHMLINLNDPTLDGLIYLGIVEKIAYSIYKATCQKCLKSWFLRFVRVSKECNLCKCQFWWLKTERRGPKKK